MRQMYERWRRRADKWLCNEVGENPGYFDFRWRMLDGRYRIKAFSITWILGYIILAIIGTYAVWASMVIAIIIGG